MFQFADRHSCPFSETTRPVLGLTQPSVPWLTGALSLVINRRRRETDQSLLLAPRFRICGAVPQVPTRLHGVDKDNLVFTFIFSYNVQSKCKLNMY
jgi:hypothetical protein